MDFKLKRLEQVLNKDKVGGEEGEHWILNVLCGPVITFVHKIKCDHNQHKVIKRKQKEDFFLIGEFFKVATTTTLMMKCLTKEFSLTNLTVVL